MPEPTTEQQITIDIIDAVDAIARGAIANAIALQGAAETLRGVTTPRGGRGSITFAICTPCAGGGDEEAHPEPCEQEPVSEPVETARVEITADGVNIVGPVNVTGALTPLGSELAATQEAVAPRGPHEEEGQS
jgi:hypothetical protein